MNNNIWFTLRWRCCSRPRGFEIDNHKTRTTLQDHWFNCRLPTFWQTTRNDTISR